MPGGKKLLRTFRKVLFYSLPAVLLFLILRRVDLVRLMSGLRNTDPALIILGIGMRPLQILLGGLRWRLLGNHYCKTELPRGYMIGHYWAGAAVGYFTPGNLGWDAYRVITLGRRAGSYAASLLTIVAEKVFGLVSVSFMGLALFPLVVDRIQGDTAAFRHGYLLALALTSAAVIGAIVLGFMGKRRSPERPLNNLLKRFSLGILGSIRNQRISSAITRDLGRLGNPLSIMGNPGGTAAAAAYSLGILVVAAVCSQLILRGMGQDVGFLVNLFAAPVFFIIFLVPVSFGSLGVREAAFILFYGRFGVQLETALLLSFFNLMGLVLNSVIGALMMWMNPELRIRERDTSQEKPLT